MCIDTLVAHWSWYLWMVGVSQVPSVIYAPRVDLSEGTDVYLRLPKLVSFFSVSKWRYVTLGQGHEPRGYRSIGVLLVSV